MNLKADNIYADFDENDVLIIGFASNEDESKYFMIQKSNDYDGQNKELDMDTYYIEKNDQSMGMYGGIDNIELKRNNIIFRLNNEAKEKLQENQIEISFECAENEFNNLQNRINLIFKQ